MLVRVKGGYRVGWGRKWRGSGKETDCMQFTDEKDEDRIEIGDVMEYIHLSWVELSLGDGMCKYELDEMENEMDMWMKCREEDEMDIKWICVCKFRDVCKCEWRSEWKWSGVEWSGVRCRDGDEMWMERMRGIKIGGEDEDKHEQMKRKRNGWEMDIHASIHTYIHTSIHPSIHPYIHGKVTPRDRRWWGHDRDG
jgi:hypothetical protein